MGFTGTVLGQHAGSLVLFPKSNTMDVVTGAPREIEAGGSRVQGRGGWRGGLAVMSACSCLV